MLKVVEYFTLQMANLRFKLLPPIVDVLKKN